MNDKLKEITPTNSPVGNEPGIEQTGNKNIAISNYGTVQLQVNQQYSIIPQFGGGLYVPKCINREYYNIFVLEAETFDRPYFEIPRKRSLCECMSEETKEKFSGMTDEDKRQITEMPSLFMAENSQYGNADINQRVIYGFVTDYKIFENDVKIYWSGYKLDISQVRLNEMLEDLQLIGDNRFNEMNRTHWAIKRCDLIEKLREAEIAVPIFTHSGSYGEKK